MDPESWEKGYDSKGNLPRHVYNESDDVTGY